MKTIEELEALLEVATRERDEARGDLSVAMARIEAIARELGCDAQTLVEDPSVAWAELERVKTSCRMWSADMYEAGDLCNRHGNEMPLDAVRRFVSSRTAIVDMLQDRLSESRAEVERLTDERDELLVRVADAGAELRATREAYIDAKWTNAFRRGAEAMREACARVADAHCVPGTRDVIRALPIPEEP